MRISRIILVAISSLIVLQGIGLAEEELFDTKAASAHSEKGISYLKARDYDAAVNELEESLSIAPDAETYYYLGYAYYMKGRSGDSESRKKSIENFDKAYELDPRFTPNKYKPADGLAATEPGTAAPSKPAAEEQPSAASETAASSQQPAPAQAEEHQKSPAPPASEKVKNVSNVPAVPN